MDVTEQDTALRGECLNAELQTDERLDLIVDQCLRIEPGEPRPAIGEHVVNVVEDRGDELVLRTESVDEHPRAHADARTGLSHRPVDDPVREQVVTDQPPDLTIVGKSRS